MRAVFMHAAHPSAPPVNACPRLQEGHTAFATQEEADAEVLQILELYR